ncbi:MAG TPA: S46 family peptidase [Saprospiraceae bacterium]|nr:S46 family peptidase [Saprospiraceae bacterium]
MKRISLLFLLLVFVLSSTYAQKESTPNPFDYGKMWTFENPPKEWFKEAYNFEPGNAWFDTVRKSSLRFASWCSASFVSADGLIMTNHHCSRDVVVGLQHDGENFDKNGFYAQTLADERRAEGLFVEQLIQVADVTDLVKEKTKGISDDGMEAATQAALDEISKMYGEKNGWENLRIQVVTYYSGGKYSVYGYKKFDDIRLVMIPELELGFFGGDPDNFTYPRYNLDVTFWRAYDKDGKPLNTSQNFLKFNKNGAKEGDPVFVVGNPGRTERYRTVAQLEYDRDYRFPSTVAFLTHRNELMMKEYNEIASDPSKEYEAQELLNNIANVANSMKAYTGILKGLNTPELFERKVAMENYIRSKTGDDSDWVALENEYKLLNPYGWAVSDLAPSPLRGKIFNLYYKVYQLDEMLNSGNYSDSQIAELKKSIEDDRAAFNDPKELEWFKVWLDEAQASVYPGDNTISNLLMGKTTDEYVDMLKQKSAVANEKMMMSNEKDGNRPIKEDDMMLVGARAIVPKFYEASKAFQMSGSKRKMLEAKIANHAFNVYGTSLPPDATFTLRISDGVMKGYDYNGTTAPVHTTYFGLYDRYYSHNKVFPWNLPERWLNPSLDLLMSPMDCISTNDIIGGNSGSPLINKNREAVGLIFDGNIESLPGNFIFDEVGNRTVSVHAGGIYAALKYIYKAERLVNELDK